MHLDYIWYDDRYRYKVIFSSNTAFSNDIKFKVIEKELLW